MLSRGLSLSWCNDKHGLSLVGEGTVGSGLLFRPTAHPNYALLKFSKTFRKWKISMDHGPHETGALIY